MKMKQKPLAPLFPAKAGIQHHTPCTLLWIPAFAGKSGGGVGLESDKLPGALE